MNPRHRQQWKQFLGCRVLWIGIIWLVLFLALAKSLPEQPFLEFVRIVAATTSFVVAVAFSKAAWESVSSDESDSTDSLAIGIFLLAVSNFVTNVYLLLYRLAEQPAWMLNVYSFALFSGWLAAMAAVLHVWAPGVLRRGPNGDDVPPARLRTVGVVAAAGVFVTLFVLATQPNIIWLVEAMRPYLR